jgi:hypothetical protein
MAYITDTMKPKNWEECPHTVLESILWECDLEYDHYEGSKVETINEIHNGSINDTNKRIVGTAWSFITEDNFRLRCQVAIQFLQKELEETKKLVNNR